MFLDGLRLAEKVCVWKSNIPQNEADIRGLLNAIKAYGPNPLLWLTQCDGSHKAGEVEDLGNGLFKGYVTRFAPYDRAGDIDSETWYEVCSRSTHVIPLLQRMVKPAETRTYEGWVDGLLDNRVCGWCRRSGDLAPVSLQLFVDGKRLSTFVAGERREDLGNHGFFSPVQLRGVSPDAVINVRVLGTNVEVPNSGKRLSEYQTI
jgi:hypothetical protein